MVNPLGKWQVSDECCGGYPCAHCTDGFGPAFFRVTISDWAGWGGPGDCGDCANFNDTRDFAYLTTETVDPGHRWYDVLGATFDPTCLWRYSLDPAICDVTEIELAVTWDDGFGVRIWVALFDDGVYAGTSNVYDDGDLGYPADCTTWSGKLLHFLDVFGPCDNTGGTGLNVSVTAL